MKEEAKIYAEYCIRNQIAAGGSDDWQIRLGKYIVSLQYVDCPGDGFLGRLASLAGRAPQRLVAVIYQRNRDGQINAIRQISVPAKGASITTDNATVLKLFGHDGRLCQALRSPNRKVPIFLVVNGGAYLPPSRSYRTSIGGE